MDTRSLLMLMIIGVLVGIHQADVQLTAADRTNDADEGGEQRQQVCLPTISMVRFEVRKLKLPKASECQHFTRRILQVVGEKQLLSSPEGPSYSIDQQKDILEHLSKFIASLPAWSGSSKLIPRGGRTLLDYIHECIEALNGPVSKPTQVVATTTTEDQKAATAALEQEIERLRSRVAALKWARELEADKAKKANEIANFHKNELQTCASNQKELERKLSVSKKEFQDLFESLKMSNEKMHELEEANNSCEKELNAYRRAYDN